MNITVSTSSGFNKRPMTNQTSNSNIRDKLK
jgi:hypothetical protein